MILRTLATPAARRLVVYLAARVLPSLGSMCATFLCIHSLSAEEYGRFSLTWLPAGIAAGLVGGLAGQAMLRHAHELSSRSLRYGLLAFPLLASLVIAPIVLAYLVWSVGFSAATLVAVLLVPAIAVMDTRRNLFVARAQAASVFSLDVLRSLAGLVALWLLLRSAAADAFVPLLAQLLAVLTGLLAVRTTRPAAALLAGRGLDRDYIRYGLWFGGWMGIVGGFSLVERAVVESVAGLGASGRYAAQADIVNAIFAATSGALASAMMPNYLVLTRKVHALAFARLLRIGLLGTFATTLLCFAIGLTIGTLSTGHIAEVLTGDVATALTLVGAAAVWTAAGFVQKPLELDGQTRLTFIAAATALALFLVVAPLFARWWGAVGVATAKLIVGLAFVVMLVWLSRRQAR